MATITEYFEQAQLSLAAYALNLTTGISGVAYTDKLKAAGMSSSQAISFATAYSVIDQFTDSVTGFSATVFAKGTEMFFAIRGTEPTSISDWLADIDLALGTGIASNQTLAMYNYFQRLITPSESQALQVTYVFPTVDEFGNLISPGGLQTYSVNGLGYISDPGTIFTVSGHSLGGHLGMAFGRLFGRNVSQLYTYNAPGFDDASANSFFDQLNAAVGLGPSAYLDDSRSTNLYASNGFSLTAGYATTYGTDVPIFIEEGVFTQNHNIGRLTDSLALYDLFASIDPALNTPDPAVGIGKITDILKASSAQASSSLERAVDALVTFFGLEFTPLSDAQIDNREELYQRIGTLRALITNLTANSTLVVDSLANIAATDLANLAQGSTAFGYRYALRELNPFAILGNNDPYALHNQNGELDLYNVADRSGTLTTDWIIDRAKLIYAELLRNTQDNRDLARLPGTGDIITEYHHYRNGKEEIFFAQAVDSSPGQLPTQVVMFADDSGRSLVGSDYLLGDRLYGGSNTDYLAGKAGDDYLEGRRGWISITITFPVTWESLGRPIAGMVRTPCVISTAKGCCG